MADEQISVEPIKATLNSYFGVQQRITSILQRCGETVIMVGHVSWFLDNGGEYYVDVVFHNGKTTTADQFPMEWLDPRINLLAVDVSKFRKVF